MEEMAEEVEDVVEEVEEEAEDEDEEGEEEAATRRGTKTNVDMRINRTRNGTLREERNPKLRGSKACAMVIEHIVGSFTTTPKSQMPLSQSFIVSSLLSQPIEGS